MELPLFFALSFDKNTRQFLCDFHFVETSTGFKRNKKLISSYLRIQETMNTLQEKTFKAHQNRLQVVVESPNSLSITYSPKTNCALFDVCDLNGRILITGEIDSDVTAVEISELYPDQYILLVLDGDKVCSAKFSTEH